MGYRLAIAHPIRVLFGVTATLGASSAGLGGFKPAGIDLARIRGKFHGHSTTPAQAAGLARLGSGEDRFERVDFVLAPRSSMPWMQ